MLVTIAEELYVVPPKEFTAERTARAKLAKAAGDADLATTVGRLPKPSVSAWVVNLLARHRPEEVGGLVELGEDIRAAQEQLDGPKLKELGRRRQEAIRSVATTGAGLAADAGHPVPAAAASEVEQTLQAVLADAGAAAAVRTGRLIRSLASTGLEPVDVSDAVAGGFDVVGAAPAPRPSAKRVASAEHAREDAERRLDDARASLAEIEQRLDVLAEQRAGVRAVLEDLRKRLAEAERDGEAAEREAAELERDRARAAALVADAEQAAGDARERLRRVSH